jgi:hypothetical protein
VIGEWKVFDEMIWGDGYVFLVDVVHVRIICLFVFAFEVYLYDIMLLQKEPITM